jgi:hypothetical protein
MKYVTRNGLKLAILTLFVFASAVEGAVFYQGVNLGGPAVVIEGNQWISQDAAVAAGMSLTLAQVGTGDGQFGFPLHPAADSDTALMLSSSLWVPAQANGSGFTISQKLPNGTYQLYFWAVEDYQAYSRKMSIQIGGVTVATNVGYLPVGGWQKYGPFQTTVKNGLVTIKVLQSGSGDSSISGFAIYSVTSTTQPPSVTLTAPTSGTAFYAPASINMMASASVSSGTINKVDFLQGTKLLTTVTKPPYAYNWNSVAAGSYTLTARATDSVGQTATSVPVTVAVRAAQAPTVSLSASATSVQAPGTVTLTASASAPSGTVSRIDLLQNSTTLQSLAAAPYTFAVSNLPAGTYTYNARVTDNLGNTAISAAVIVTVTAWGSIDVKTAYGAKGDGVSDDTAAIQAAVQSCQPGNVVYFPAGTYIVGGIELQPGCTYNGVQRQSVLKARDSSVSFIFTRTNSDPTNIVVTNLIFDGAGIKLDWGASGVRVNYNIFRNISSGETAVQFSGGTGKSSSARASISYNIFQNLVGNGISFYYTVDSTDISYNYFDTFLQGISKGSTDLGSDVNIEHNTFLHGQRMAIEFMSQIDFLRVRYNYVAQWRGTWDPTQERYDLCPAAPPYSCNAFGLSIATGGQGQDISGNLLYGQPGQPLGIEYTAAGANSLAQNNVIENFTEGIMDVACANISSCSVTRPNITNNLVCSGNASWNLAQFANWPTSNRYVSNCPDPSVPAAAPVPAMPF